MGEGEERRDRRPRKEGQVFVELRDDENFVVVPFLVLVGGRVSV